MAAARSAGLQLVIAGAPASGKGTQCELIRDTYNLVHLSTGDMLREAAKDQTSELGRTAKEYMEQGKLVPDLLIIAVVVERLKQPDCMERGWLLDGFPRTRAQADAMVAAGIIVDCFVFLDVPDSMLVERVVGRRADPVTGKIYHLKFSPPETSEIASRLQQRADDTEEKVKVRLAAFHHHTSAIMALYKQELYRVHGEGNKNLIFEQIKARLDRIRRYTVVFVLGGPGSGKGTQCANIVAEFGYTHLSAGDLLRAEQNSGSDTAAMINQYIKEGKIVPVEVTVNLLKKVMEGSGNRKFLIDGFPRSQDNLDGWFAVMGEQADVAFVLFFDCPEDVMTVRLMDRGKTSGRADDNMESIKKRFVTFKEQSLPVVNAFGRLGKVRKVSAVPPPDVVFSRVRRIFTGMSLLPPVERTLAMIKPDAVKAGKAEEIVQRIQAEGFVVVGRKDTTLTDGWAQNFYGEHKGKPFYEPLIGFMTSGPVVGLCLERIDAIKAWRALMGPTDSGKAKAEAPKSIRALYGTDGRQNASHGSDSTKSAAREMALWFPEPLEKEVTLAMIKPGTAETHKQDILDILAARGFDVLKTSSQTLTRAQAEEFYAEHQGKPFFEGLATYMTSGEMMALMLQREAAINAWRALMGPTDSNKARTQQPDSIRALYGTDGRVNATHGSDSIASATRECMYWFPDKSADTSGSRERQEMVNYLQKTVDPIFAPLLQRLLVARPKDVVSFVCEDLKRLQVAA